MSRITPLPERFLVGASAALVILFCVPAWSAAQGQPAVVEGTSQLFIRRGPGREFPPFATLTGGSQVRLEERHGAWARVTTASGQVGYVHNKFLRVVDEAAAAATAPPPATATAGAPTRAQSTRPQSTRPRPTATRRQRTAMIPTEPEPVATATAEIAPPPPTMELQTKLRPRPQSGDVQREIERLSEAVEALNRRLDQRFPLPDGVTSPATEANTGVSGGAILLGLAGAIVGWFLGATYQRNKERGRRSRIRL